MLFRNNKGDLIEIKKYNFTNDKLYYQKIMEIKQLFTKSTKPKDLNYSNYVIQNLIKI